MRRREQNYVSTDWSGGMKRGMEGATEPQPQTNQPVVLANMELAALDPRRKWAPFREGIEISPLYTVPGGMAAGFLRFSPGAELPRHYHTAHEHIFVLIGSQQDDLGVHRAGSMLLHPPGTSHAVSSPEGCIVLAIWGAPVSFEPLS
jgi:anti-sigma factor ChrR (cupin superfamily)